MATHYASSYAEARSRFRSAAVESGFTLQSLDHGTSGPSGEPLTIDIAIKGSSKPQHALVVSSGTHGVEGYFGSAVQHALLLEELREWTPEEGQAVVLIHGVNPWGFAHQRRVDHEGIDLNRNFRGPDAPYEGAPDGYHRLNDMLNPSTPPGGLDPWLLSAGAQIVRHGFRALKDAIAQGQYEYERGLFFGGKGPSTSKRMLEEALPKILGGAERVLHLDLHTGSGPWGTYICAVDMPMDSTRVQRLKQELGADTIQGLDPSGVLYQINGALGPWLQGLMPEVEYDCLLAEFGTYHNIRVLMGLRYENRIVHHGVDHPELAAKGRAEMMEMFCPADTTWREECLTQARELTQRGMAAIFESGS